MKLAQERSEISIVGYCSGLGQKVAGLEMGPSALKSYGLIDALQRHSCRVQEWVDIYPNYTTQKNKNWEPIENLYHRGSSILSKAQRLLTIGGDHSLAIGSIRATLKHFPNAKVVWIDAHGDINTPQTSITGNLHGMPLAALLGLFESPFDGPRLAPENLFMMGLRDLDPGEVKILAEQNISVLSSEEIATFPERSFRKFRDWLQNSKTAPVHLSFDIDSLDPRYAPATSLRVPNGLSMDFAADICRFIAEQNSLVAMDLVEINPLNISNHQQLEDTLMNAQTLIQCAFSSH